ncbi:hypothetical protein NQ314_020797 [Rhamnusium bicolor]|uniref:Uncharacterized protein n=1 Tax=Rhamnusium bicolor TaxID=1586634 RepID=A0AAV8WL24_9CUCU|nr:hypothetical protein NQ314_020797 [Rhamnusium bicolor]
MILGLEGLDEDGDNRSKTKVTIMESLSGEDGNFVSNVGTMIGGKVGNIFGKGLGGIGSKLGEEQAVGSKFSTLHQCFLFSHNIY